MLSAVQITCDGTYLCNTFWRILQFTQAWRTALSARPRVERGACSVAREFTAALSARERMTIHPGTRKFVGKVEKLELGTAVPVG